MRSSDDYDLFDVEDKSQSIISHYSRAGSANVPRPSYISSALAEAFHVPSSSVLKRGHLE